MNKNKSNKIEIAFFLFALVFAAIILFSAVYSLIFLSAKMFYAFSTETQTEESTKFNIEEFKKLGF